MRGRASQGITADDQLRPGGALDNRQGDETDP